MSASQVHVQHRCRAPLRRGGTPHQCFRVLQGKSIGSEVAEIEVLSAREPLTFCGFRSSAAKVMRLMAECV